MEIKRNINKDYNPLDPRYIISTKSGRKQIIGTIDENKPKIFLRRPYNIDSKRILRTDDIEGAQPYYKRSGKPQKVNFNFKHNEALVEELNAKGGLTSRRINSIDNNSNEVSPNQTEHLIEINGDIVPPVESIKSMRNNYSAYRNRSRQMNTFANKIKSDGVINYDNLKKNKLSIDKNSIQNTIADPYNIKSVYLREIDENQKKILDDFKKFSKARNLSLQHDSKELNKYELKSKRQINKSFVRNVPELNYDKQHVENKGDLKNNRSISYININENDIDKRKSGENSSLNEISSKVQNNNLKNLITSQRPSEYRNKDLSINKNNVDSIPNTKRSRILHAMKAESKDAPKVSPFTRSRIKNLEKSSGVYGNFVSIDQIDKALNELAYRKNHSIAF